MRQPSYLVSTRLMVNTSVISARTGKVTELPDPAAMHAAIHRALERCTIGPAVRPELGPCWIAPTKTRPHTRISGGHGQKPISIQTARAVLGAKLGRPVGKGMQACHHCDVMTCIRPSHLYEANQSSNIQDCSDRGRLHLAHLPKAAAAARAEKLARTHCRKGHPYTGERHYYGSRRCGVCFQAKMQREYAAKREAKRAA
jgi:hypothetical protein